MLCGDVQQILYGPVPKPGFHKRFVPGGVQIEYPLQMKEHLVGCHIPLHHANVGLGADMLGGLTVGIHQHGPAQQMIRQREDRRVHHVNDVEQLPGPFTEHHGVMEAGLGGDIVRRFCAVLFLQIIRQ